jgi:predicted nucleotidyltransferase
LFQRFLGALRQSRYRSVAQVARQVGIHRNTLYSYLSGKPLVSAKLEATLEALGLGFDDAVVQVRPRTDSDLIWVALAVDKLHDLFPEVTLVLFGSRAEGRAHRYSDVDLGAFSRDGLPHERFRQMLEAKVGIEQELPVGIQLVNLNLADPEFLRSIGRSWQFVSGWQGDWIALDERRGQ